MSGSGIVEDETLSRVSEHRIQRNNVDGEYSLP